MLSCSLYKASRSGYFIFLANHEMMKTESPDRKRDIPLFNHLETLTIHQGFRGTWRPLADVAWIIKRLLQFERQYPRSFEYGVMGENHDHLAFRS